MPVRFKIKVSTPGASDIDSYTGADGKTVSKLIAGAMEDSVVLTGAALLTETMESFIIRNLYLSAIFFQRVVCRTPVDEDYLYMDSKDNLEFHKKDDDSVRDAWTVSYNNAKITARQMMDSGISFGTFNDRNDIDKIFELFKAKFLKGKSRELRQVRISNGHKRFAMLEYGEYPHDNGVRGKGKYYHGTDRGYTIQAPYGMTRITEAEFQQMSLSMSTEELIGKYVKKSNRLKKTPSKSKMKRLKSLILDRTHLSDSDIGSAMEIMQ